MFKAILPLSGIFLFCSLCAGGEATTSEKKLYRDMILTTRTEAEFKVPMPDHGDLHFNYKLVFDQPKWNEPITTESSVLDDQGNPSSKFIRYFFDKIFLKDGSYLEVGGEQIPLTCIHVDAQDNRFSGKSGPLVPDFILKIIFVANDWSCMGPINPGWPGNGGKKEAWDTYVHYTVKDPTIMLPVDAGLRYRWSEFQAVLVK